MADGSPESKRGNFKEKMVGATALLVLVVIFVPWILDQPVRQNEELPEVTVEPAQAPPLPTTVPQHHELPSQGDASKGVAADLQSWVLQVGLFPDQESADAMAAELQQNGYRAFVHQSAEEDAASHLVLIGPELGVDSLRRDQQNLEQNMKIKGVLKKYAGKADTRTPGDR